MTPSVIILFRQNICVTIIWHLFGFLALEQITALHLHNYGCIWSYTINPWTVLAKKISPPLDLDT